MGGSGAHTLERVLLRTKDVCAPLGRPLLDPRHAEVVVVLDRVLVGQPRKAI